MEVYILDSLLRRTQVVDIFESLIWTERYKDAGDFELVLNSTLENRNLFPVGTRLAMNESFRVMTVETVEDKTDADGKTTFTVKGTSLEILLDDRMARSAFNMEAGAKWSITDLPAVIARKIFHDICVTGVLSADDVIPYIHEGSSLFPIDTIAEPSDTITYEMDPVTVYSAIKQLCDLYDMGFRLIRNFDTSQLYFDIYMGSDRTTAQSTLPAVIFSPDFDNLQNTNELTTIAGYKNVAYVITPNGDATVYPDDVDPALVTGLDRHVLVVSADDITETDPDLLAAQITQRGKEELSKYRRLSAFDGEISQSSKYKYQRDYWLGDLLEVRNRDGVTNNMQVTEQIFASDGEGERSYPTLSLNKFITPGTWAAWDFNEVWDDVDDTTHWADL